MIVSRDSSILQLTKFTSNKKTKFPHTTIAATNCEGNPPLEIDKAKEKKPCLTEITIRLTYPKRRKL